MKDILCFFCDKEFKWYESYDEYPYDALSDDTPDDVLSPMSRPLFVNYKTGFFNKKTIHICRECEISLNMEYGATRTDTVDKTIYYGFDMCYEILYTSGRIDFGKGENVWHKRKDKYNLGSDKYLQGKLLEDIKDKDNLHSLKNKIAVLTGDWKKYANSKSKTRESIEDALKSRIKHLKQSIIKLLTTKSIKMPASDIDAHLKNKDVDEIKELCEEMYHNGKIGRTGNYRYFILTEEKKKPKPKKASAPKSEKVDVKAELKKYKEMLDDGLITQEQYDAKSNELLGL